jgi:hypothetical protein
MYECCRNLSLECMVVPNVTTLHVETKLESADRRKEIQNDVTK